MACSYKNALIISILLQTEDGKGLPCKILNVDKQGSAAQDIISGEISLAENSALLITIWRILGHIMKQ